MKSALIKKSFIFLVSFILSGVSVAESSVIADIKEKNRLHKYDPLIPFSERAKEISVIEGRVMPVVSQEVTKIIDGEITPLMCDLLKDPDASLFTINVMRQWFQTYSDEKNRVMLESVFNATPAPLRGRVLWLFISDLPKEVFSAQEVQKWLVGKINGGLPAGAFYFILTDESAEAVSKTAKASMARFSKKREHSDENLFSLISAAFLASRGEDAAVKLLDSLLDKRNIESTLDTAYVLQAAAMSGNKKLIQKIRGIITTDKRSKWNGRDVIPKKASFAHIAASACALTIEKFPSVEYWDDYDEDMEKQVHEWLKDNPAHTIKPNPLVFFMETPFERVITAMWHQIEKEQNEKKQ